jgi:hypothetical protein
MRKCMCEQAQELRERIEALEKYARWCKPDENSQPEHWDEYWALGLHKNEG